MRCITVFAFRCIRAFLIDAHRPNSPPHAPVLGAEHNVPSTFQPSAPAALPPHADTNTNNAAAQPLVGLRNCHSTLPS